jgi:hypothetical protein
MIKKMGFFIFSGTSGHHRGSPSSKQHQKGSFLSLLIALFNQKPGIYGYCENDGFHGWFL